MSALREHRRRIMTALIVSAAAVATMALGTATADAMTLTPTLSWSPTTSSDSFDYGNVVVGSGPAQTFTLRNSGLLPTGRLSVSLTGSRAFTITADSCTGANLAWNKTCAVTLRYAPAEVGESVATLSARSVFGARASLTLRGTGVTTTGTLIASWTFTDLSVTGSGLLPGSEIDWFGVDSTSGTTTESAVGVAAADGTFTWSLGFTPPCALTHVYFTGTDSFGAVTSNTIRGGPYCSSG